MNGRTPAEGQGSKPATKPVNAEMVGRLSNRRRRSEGLRPRSPEACRYDLAMGERRAIVEARRDEIHALVRQHRGRTAALFGSVARGEDTATSDIDFLVDFEVGSSLFDLLHLQDELAALLGFPVDVVSVGGLKPRDAHIRRDALPL